MEETLYHLHSTLVSITDAIDEQLALLIKSSKLDDKKELAKIVLSLSKSQENTAKAIDLLNQDPLDYFNDDFDLDDFDDDEIDAFDKIPEGKQVEFKPKKKKGKGKKKDDGDDLPF
jgi:hypothetical protein